MIAFSDIQSSKIQLKELKDYFILNISNEDLMLHQSSEIAYQCLKKINFRKLEKTETSITKYAIKILNLTYPFSKENLNNPLQFFLLLFLDLKQLPLELKVKLEKTSRLHLENINNLVKHYESIDFIKKVISEKIKPRNHQERILLTFYNRSLDKQKEVESYLLFKINHRAIENARSSNLPKELKIPENVKLAYEQYRDFPYLEPDFEKNKWTYKINYEKLDYRLINPWRNKSSVYNFKSDISNPNNLLLEKELKTINSKKFLKIICSKISDLPIINEREEIFIELSSLYSQKKWYGFYALALPQIEGIFSEMVKITKTNKTSHTSLTDKVQAIRPFYEMSSYSFDYYEYYLPNQRNKFSHTGFDENIEIKCKQLLLDLVHILKIFEKLNSPIIELDNLMKEKTLKDISKMSRFINLVTQIKTSKQLHVLESKIENYVNEKFSEVKLNLLFKKLKVDFEFASSDLERHLEGISLLLNNNSIKIFSISKKEAVANIKQISAVLNSEYSRILVDEELKLLLDTINFCRGIILHFPNLSCEKIALIERFQSENKQIIQIIDLLNPKIQFELPTQFLLKKWKHTST